MEWLREALVKKKKDKGLIERFVNDPGESADIRDALEGVVGKKEAAEYKIIVDFKEGIHQYCPYGFDLTIDVKNKIAYEERYDNYEKNYTVVKEEVEGYFDGSYEPVKEPNLRNI